MCTFITLPICPQSKHLRGVPFKNASQASIANLASWLYITQCVITTSLITDLSTGGTRVFQLFDFFQRKVLIVIHLGFASATALASAMIPIVIAVLQGVGTAGINVVGMTMLLQFVVSFGFILVVNAPQNMVAYGTDTFEARDFVRTGLVLTLIAFSLVMLLGATYWRWLGYV